MAKPKCTSFGTTEESYTVYQMVLGSRIASLIEAHGTNRTLIAELPIEQWQAIAEPVKAHFNERLKKLRIKTGQWSKLTILEKLFGKELALLMLALAGATDEQVERVLANWNGLRPEERWWLYTQIYSVGHGKLDPDKGWYKGIMIALREN